VTVKEKARMDVPRFSGDDDVTPEIMMRLSYNGNSNDHGNGGNTCSESDVDSQAYEEDNEEEEEDDDAFIERMSNMVDMDDLLDNEGVEARESVESEARESVESEARESVASVEDLSDRVNIRRSGGTNEALQLNEELNEALELHELELHELELHDHNEMSKRVKDSDDEHVHFLFDRGRAADSIVTSDIEQQQQVEQQQARESAGIEEKWQSGRCRFEMQVCDSGWALAQLDDSSS
jgi:hypothetical protein